MISSDGPPDDVIRPWALSPSRASDFTRCPLLYRLRAIDRLHEPPSPAALRGTLVHAVLERMFDQPAPDRTPTRIAALVGPVWTDLREDLETARSAQPAPPAPVVAALPTGPADPMSGRPAIGSAEWLASAEALVLGYFTLEDPRRFTPQDRELSMELVQPDGVRLRGIIDRIDVAGDGRLRVVDYKSGSAPGLGREGRAMNQLLFYALLVLRLKEVLPAELTLLYLGSRAALTVRPHLDQLTALERRTTALWQRLELSRATGEFPAVRNPGCSWCTFRSLCPEWGGTPPPYQTPQRAPVVSLASPPSDQPRSGRSGEPPGHAATTLAK